jgi:hypothetical protein
MATTTAGEGNNSPRHTSPVAIPMLASDVICKEHAEYSDESKEEVKEEEEEVHFHDAVQLSYVGINGDEAETHVSN